MAVKTMAAMVSRVDGGAGYRASAVGVYGFDGHGQTPEEAVSLLQDMVQMHINGLNAVGAPCDFPDGMLFTVEY